MVTTNIARTDDGTIQINFAIPKADIDKAQEKALADLSKDVTIAGFRKGKAPVEKVKEKVDAGKLLEKTLGTILPDAYTKALIDNKIKPIIYPKFEILKQGDTNNGDDTWEVQAKIAELPQIELGDYKKIIKNIPKKTQDLVIRALLDSVEVKIPKIIVDDEVNRRLSELLERTEKLGLKIEQYLSSIGKDEKKIREEYQKQVTDGVSLELILNKIAEVEKTKVDEKDVDAAIQASGVQTQGHEEHTHLEEQKVMVRSVLKRRIVLDQLTKLA